ncbi:MAG: hypothetical protein KGY74_09985 [Candidatus Cloacimonetes bacterium]|nr:hypothetical protein [Candidatus Cloacimonadota bacterium]
MIAHDVNFIIINDFNRLFGYSYPISKVERVNLLKSIYISIRFMSSVCSIFLFIISKIRKPGFSILLNLYNIKFIIKLSQIVLQTFPGQLRAYVQQELVFGCFGRVLQVMVGEGEMSVIGLHR